MEVWSLPSTLRRDLNSGEPSFRHPRVALVGMFCVCVCVYHYIPVKLQHWSVSMSSIPYSGKFSREKTFTDQ